jgi:hypothetical protein
MAQAYMRGMPVEQDARGSAPLITLFERDDSIAVPLLSQLRMAGYDVRSARTPVELFDILGKNLVALVLVDLGAATAGRREFWVALDAQRRGRSLQVLTFRFMAPVNDLDLDFEPSARAIADVEIHGAHEFQRVIDAVHQRAPLYGPPPAAAVSYSPDGAIQPLGAALGLAPTPYAGQYDGGYGGYGAPASPSQRQGGYASGYGASYGPAQMPAPGYDDGPFGMATLTPSGPFGAPMVGAGGYNSGPPGGFPPQAFPPQAFPPQSFPPSPSMPPMQGFGAPVPPQYGAPIEQPQFPEGMYAHGGFPQQGSFAPQSQPYGQPGFAQPGSYANGSPFAHPTAANPFSPDVVTSPFAQPYGSNPFAQDASAPSTPPSPFAHGVGQTANPFGPAGPFGPGGPAAHSGPAAPGFSQPSGPPSWGAGSGGYVAAAPGFAGWPDWRTPDAGPDSLGSDPGVQNMYAGGPHTQAGGYSLPPTPSAPVFQDAWTPPDGESEMETGALSEDAFQQPVGAWSTASPDALRRTSAPQYNTGQERPWDAPRVSSGNLGGNLGGSPESNPSGAFGGQPAQRDFDATPYAAQEAPQHTPDVYERSTATVAAPVSEIDTHALAQSRTPTETALGSVLVEGALLTPNKLETLRGIQAMLSSAGMPRKLGELAVMFRFLSADQLLAALLVSRGLVSPQQIASLGQVKQEMAANGMENDLESLLIRFNILPADQLHHLRQELAS